MSENNKLEILAFDKIMNNCNDNLKKIFNKGVLTEDSKLCVDFIIENNFELTDTILPIFFIKSIYEIVGSYQQILDQFDLEEEIKEISIGINNNKYSNIQYLIMYLYSYKPNLLNDLINKSFRNRYDKEVAMRNVETIEALENNYLNTWFNGDGYKFYELLLGTLNRNLDNNIVSIFNNIKRNVYNPFSSLEIQNAVEKDFDKVNKYDVLFTLSEESKDNHFRASVTQTSIDKRTLKYYFATILVIPVLISNTKKISIECWHTKEKKMLPNSSSNAKILGPNEVNTGVTSFFGEFEEITILRDEEINKVIIHEIIHAKNLDFGMENLNTEDKIINWLKIHCRIPNDTKILINESYVELWATIINSIICAHNINPSELLCTIKNILSIERMFSCFQTAKILHFFNFNSFSEFFSIKGWDASQLNNSIYKQNSSVLSYYIIKSAILFNITDFFEFFKSHKSLKHLIKFDISEENMKKYFELIVTSLNKEEFAKHIDFYINKIKKNKNDSFIYRTLRMTAVSFYKSK